MGAPGRQSIRTKAWGLRGKGGERNAVRLPGGDWIRLSGPFPVVPSGLEGDDDPAGPSVPAKLFSTPAKITSIG